MLYSNQPWQMPAIKKHKTVDDGIPLVVNVNRLLRAEQCIGAPSDWGAPSFKIHVLKINKLSQLDFLLAKILTKRIIKYLNGLIEIKVLS